MENQEDKAALAKWLDDVGAPGIGEAPEIERLTGGSQNELFTVTRSGLTGVLRMPPTGADDARLDGLRRELRLLAALKGSEVPHAELIGGEPTGEVLGSPFYLMEAIDGWSPTGSWAAPFDTDLKARGELAFELGAE